MKRIIRTTKAPAAIGPYSQAVEINNTLYISGQLGIDPASGRLVDGGIKAQTEQALNNIRAILNDAGYSLIEVVRSTCYLTDMADFSAMNEVYSRFFFENQPARAAFAVKALPLGALIEIETIAAK